MAAFTFKETVDVKRKRNFDVIVAGGGIAGCAAALAARRRGHSVLLVEKMIYLGGLATNGLVVHYNHSLCDRKGRKLIGGISEELLHRSIKYGRSNLPPEWTYRAKQVDTGSIYKTEFSVPSFVAALDEVMQDDGVEILFDSVCCNVIMEDGVCTGVIMENKEGRVHYGCRQLIDTTGDLDLFKRAGAPCIEDLNWLSFLGFRLRIDKLKECYDKGDLQDVLQPISLGTDRDGLRNPPDVRRYTVENGEEITKFILRGRKYLLDYLKTMDVTKEMVVQIPTQAQYRATRFLESEYILGRKDKNVHHDDSIGCMSTYRENGFCLEVPYRCLVAKGYKNMITAGRSISAVSIAREITRLIAPGAMTGEAAGIAAGLAIELSCDINDVPVEKLQREITAAEGIIHF